MNKKKPKDLVCEHCGISFSRITKDTTKRHYCSKVCRTSDKNSYLSEWTPERRAKLSNSVSGENNPNFGNHWSEEQKAAASRATIERYKNDPEYRYRVGSSNRGVKFSEERIRKMHANRTTDSYRHFPTEEVRKVIGEKSKEKWTPEYKEKHRKTMEELGHWVPRSEISEYRLYYKESNWIQRMIDYFNEQDLENLKQFGIFNKNNTSGFVRDHIVSRKIGFEFGLPSFIIRHPANLQFISHAENIKKGFAERKLTKIEKEAIINKLLTDIASFSKEWSEQEACINFIRERRLF